MTSSRKTLIEAVAEELALTHGIFGEVEGLAQDVTDFVIKRLCLETGLLPPDKDCPYEFSKEVRDAVLGVKPKRCQHRIADARNPVVKSGYVCIDCGAVFSAADHGAAEVKPQAAPIYNQAGVPVTLTDKEVGSCIDWTDAQSQYGRHHFGWFLDFVRSVEAVQALKARR